MELGLQQKLALKQKITPQMIQSITYLQYNLEDLNQEIEKQLEENVLLEKDASDNFNDPISLDNPEVSDFKVSDLAEVPVFDQDTPLKLEKIEEKNDFTTEDWKQFFENQGQSYEGYKARNSDFDDLYDPDRKEGKSQTLKEYLLNQVKTSLEHQIDEQIAELLIENINYDGFLFEQNEGDVFVYVRDSINKIYDNNVVEENDVKEVLAKIHYFEPVGCGAFTKTEALSIQAQYYEYDDYIIDIIKYDLEMLAHNKIKELREKYNIPDSKIKRAVDLIRKLEPIPGRIFYPDTPQHIEPEIRLLKEGENYRVELINERIPKLRISNHYREQLLNPSTDEKTREYIEEKILSAKNIINSITQRKTTIVRVMESIVKVQKQFLDSNGDFSHFKAITLKDIAMEVDLDESTVSRATSGKYVICDIGLFELKFFFSTSVAVTGGENQSMRSVKNLIKKIISNENKKKPYSDSKISKMLKTEYSLNISRKSVGNYRMSLEIPSSSIRKEIL